MQTIAFIGLGNMGSGMAANQARSGRRVQAFDLSPKALATAEKAGCVACASAGDAISGADTIITMLPSGQHVQAVYQNDVLAHAAHGAALIDCSTIDIDSARAIAAMARQANRNYRIADAPVSGGTRAADAGTLSFMVGCEATDFDTVKTALEPMSRSCIHAGNNGAGQAAKICNNMLLAVSMIGTCEAFALAERLGLAPQKFYDIASQSSGQSWSMTQYCPVRGVGPQSPADNDFNGGFATDMMLKDLRLAKQATLKSDAITPLGGQAEALYAILSRSGMGALDFSVIMKMFTNKTSDTAKG